MLPLDQPAPDAKVMHNSHPFIHLPDLPISHIMSFPIYSHYFHTFFCSFVMCLADLISVGKHLLLGNLKSFFQSAVGQKGELIGQQQESHLVAWPTGSWTSVGEVRWGQVRLERQCRLGLIDGDSRETHQWLTQRCFKSILIPNPCKVKRSIIKEVSQIR